MLNLKQTIIEDSVMADIETLGTRPGSVVAAIGLVRFMPDLGRVQTAEEMLKNSVRVIIDISESIKEGFTVDGATIHWWLKQSKEAKDATFLNGQQLEPLVAAVGITEFFAKGDKVWGNGSNFDMPLMEAYFNKYDVNHPWAYNKVRCYRTIKAMHNYNADLVAGNLLAHDCVSDAIYQAQTLQAIAIANPNLIWR